MQYESIGVHGVRRSISIDSSQVARGAHQVPLQGTILNIF